MPSLDYAACRRCFDSLRWRWRLSLKQLGRQQHQQFIQQRQQHQQFLEQQW
jgi:hypothetical protein